MSDNDIIKIKKNIILKDNNGNNIPVVTPKPEVVLETFSFNERLKSTSTSGVGDE